MSKLFCGECMEIVDEPHTWTEYHIPGEPHTYEPMSGCDCGNALTEIDPCEICGEYPEDEYYEGELPDGICAECFNNGAKEHYMEYIVEDKGSFVEWLIEKSKAR